MSFSAYAPASSAPSAPPRTGASLAQELTALVEEIQRTRDWFNSQIEAQLASLRQLRATMQGCQGGDTPLGAGVATLHEAPHPVMEEESPATPLKAEMNAAPVVALLPEARPVPPPGPMPAFQAALLGYLPDLSAGPDDTGTPADLQAGPPPAPHGLASLSQTPAALGDPFAKPSLSLPFAPSAFSGAPEFAASAVAVAAPTPGGDEEPAPQPFRAAPKTAKVPLISGLPELFKEKAAVEGAPVLPSSFAVEPSPSAPPPVFTTAAAMMLAGGLTPSASPKVDVFSPATLSKEVAVPEVSAAEHVSTAISQAFAPVGATPFTPDMATPKLAPAAASAPLVKPSMVFSPAPVSALDPELEQATLRELNDALAKAFSEISARGGMLG